MKNNIKKELYTKLNENICEIEVSPFCIKNPYKILNSGEPICLSCYEELIKDF